MRTFMMSVDVLSSSLIMCCYLHHLPRSMQMHVLHMPADRFASAVPYQLVTIMFVAMSGYIRKHIDFYQAYHTLSCAMLLHLLLLFICSSSFILFHFLLCILFSALSSHTLCRGALGHPLTIATVYCCILCFYPLWFALSFCCVFCHQHPFVVLHSAMLLLYCLITGNIARRSRVMLLYLVHSFIHPVRFDHRVSL